MKRLLRVSAIQLPALPSGRSFTEQQTNLRSVIRSFLKVAGERASDLVLLGEYSNLPHHGASEKEYIPDRIPGPWTRSIARIAGKYRMNVALPLFGIYRGAVSSYVALFGRNGEFLTCYQKAHPTESEQALGIVPGNELPVFDLDCARVGVMTCMDIEYPEVAQALMLRGAELLLFPHVQAGWGELDWEIRYRARAIDTGLPVLSACYGYPEGEWAPGKMIGRSSLVGRDGLMLGDLGRAIGVLTLEIDLEGKRRTPFFFSEPHDRAVAVAASRRPELYSDLTEMRHKLKALSRLHREAKRAPIRRKR
jgi:predicted amidohydrolase